MKAQKIIHVANVEPEDENITIHGEGDTIYVPSWSEDATIDKLEWMVTNLAYDEKGVHSVDFIALCNAVDGLREYRNILQEDGIDTSKVTPRSISIRKPEPTPHLRLVKSVQLMKEKSNKMEA